RPSPSPTLDRLAARGLLFEDSVSQSSWTMPSVASIFTGLHPRSHGAAGMNRASGDAMSRAEFLADAVLTWAELAQRAGLTTVGVSANPLVGRATNLAQGFETFSELPWNSKIFGWPPATEVNALFLDWLRQHRAWRFVAYLHYMEPHDPYSPPARLRAPPSPGMDSRIATGWATPLANAINFHGAPPLSAAEIGHLRALYDGEIRPWDETLGELLRDLEALGV